MYRVGSHGGIATSTDVTGSRWQTTCFDLVEGGRLSTSFVMTMFPYQLHVYTSITPEIEPPEVGSLHLGECVVVLQARCMYARSR